MARFRFRSVVIVLLAAAVLLAAVPGTFRLLLWRWELNPILRGRLVAEEAGCMACHRPFARTSIPNPGSRWGTVPAFEGGNPMMYGSTERRVVEEYVRFGAPRKWLDNPVVRERLASQRLRMPAYEGVLREQQIADVVEFASAVEGVELVGGKGVGEGRALAREHGCLSCHGVEGSGGLPNPGSMGGFIPGFLGRNFTDLVRGEADFREWVLDGTSARLESNPWVRFFWKRQRIAMPAYRGELGDEEIARLWAWVRAVRQAVN